MINVLYYQTLLFTLYSDTHSVYWIRIAIAKTSDDYE
jgi:hypothetical protein